MAAPQPVRCIEAVMQRGIRGIYGNTEERIVNENAPIPPYLLENPDWLASYHATSTWTKEQLKADHFEFLRSLPFSLTIKPTANSADSLLMVHGTPSSVSHGILPPEAWQETHLKEVRQSDKRVLELLEGVAEQTIVYGHVHVPNVRQVGSYKLINVSSVSRAQDWDLRAKYAILEFKGGEWQVEHRHVDYDTQHAIQVYLNSGMPYAYEATRWLRAGGEDNW